jgi:hypothetical protein
MLGLSKDRELQRQWQRVCELPKPTLMLSANRLSWHYAWMPNWTLAALRRQGGEAEKRPTRKREQNMAWIVSTVQSISLEEALPNFRDSSLDSQVRQPS